MSHLHVSVAYLSRIYENFDTLRTYVNKLLCSLCWCNSRITVINNQRSKAPPKIILIIWMNTKIKRSSGRGKTSPIAPHCARETSSTNTEATVNVALKEPHTARRTVRNIWATTVKKRTQSYFKNIITYIEAYSWNATKYETHTPQQTYVHVRRT